LTTGQAIITPNLNLAVFCSLLLGIGDSCFNTQVFSILGGLYRDDSAAAFAIFRFFQSIASATAFFYSIKLSMYYQLLLLAIFCSMGTVSFCVVEHSSNAKKRRALSDRQLLI
jgi:hypothetical protein